MKQDLSCKILYLSTYYESTGWHLLHANVKGEDQIAYRHDLINSFAICSL